MAYKRKWRARNGNRGARGSRMSRYGARGRGSRFRQGVRGGWKSMGYRMSGYKQRKGRDRPSFRKKRSSRGGYGTAGDASYVSVSALGRKRRFLGAVEKALASKTNYEVLVGTRHTSTYNQQAYAYYPLCFSDEIRQVFATSVGSTPNEGGKVYVDYAVMRMQVVNQANVACTLWFYDTVLRRDSNDSPNPDGDWQSGILALGGTTGDYLLPYSTPFKSSRFCTAWKVKKVTKVMLAPGEEHVHTLRVNVYSYVAQERLYNVGTSTAQGTTGIGSLAHMVIVAGLGGVVNDNTTKTIVGYAPVAYDVAATKNYRGAALYDDKKKYVKLNSLGTIAAGSTMVEVDADPSTMITA